jgi:serine protease Do
MVLQHPLNAAAVQKDEPQSPPLKQKFVQLPDIADLVEDLKGTVVNIQVSKKIKTTPSPMPFFRGPGGEKDPFREFFEKFFGERLPKEFEQKSAGSGFIISSDGYILTNNHVIEGADKIVVKLSDKGRYDAEVVGRDPNTDIALLKIDPDHLLPVAKLGDSDSLRVGEWVIAIGNPFGFEHTVTMGIVSAKGRVIGAGPYDDFIQTDAAINPGNSGGPLFNLHGEVVGINTAIVAAGQGIGFAIPINMAKEILPQLKEKGRVVRGWLGIQIQPWEPGLAEKFGLKEERGVLVGKVIEGDPADRAGMKNGDIILEINGQEVKDTKDLLNKVARLKPGQRVEVVVLRDGKRKTLYVTLGERPSEEQMARRQIQKEDKLGLAVQEITPELAKELGLKEPTGVLISEVKPGSPASEAGLRRGDIIHEIEHQKIKDLEDYRRIISHTTKKSLLLWIQRGKMRKYVVVHLKEEGKKSR